MRPFATAIVGNLVWSTTGAVWAFYEVDPLPFAHRSDEAKLDVLQQVRTLLIGVPEHSVLMGLHEQLDPAAVVGDMLEGVDIDAHRAWGSSCAATLELLSEQQLVRRLYLLGLRLPDTGRRWWSALGSAAEAVEAGFGLPPRRPRAAEVDLRRRQAVAALAKLGRVALHPVSAGRLRWLHARACRRGLDEPVFDQSWEPMERTVGSGGAAKVDSGPLVTLLDADFKEGGFQSDPGRPRRPRYLRVETDHGVSYQAFLCLSDMPAHFTFPGGGGEWWRELEEVPWPVEWCLRLRSVDNAVSQSRVRRQHRQLIAQVDEYDGEITGAPESLARAIDAIREEGAQLDANRAEREGQGTVVLALASDDLDDLEERIAALRAMFEPVDYGLGRPTGGQAALFGAFLPGSDTPPVARDYTQFMLSTAWAAGAPFTGTQLGDPTGMLLGASRDAGIEQPVLFDPSCGPRIQRSGSIGVCGGLGGGKSYLAKRILWATVARGGCASTVDRTVLGEYVTLGSVMPGRSHVVELGPEAEVCLDPLRIFTDLHDRETFTLGFLSLLTGVATQTVEGDVLSEAIEKVAAEPAARLADVITVLESSARRNGADKEARTVARRLQSLSKRRGAQVAFGDGDVLRIDADYIVFHAPGMALPDRAQLTNAHLARQLLPEQIVNLALLYLVAAIQRSVCLADPGRFAIANFDEAHYLTSSPQGEQLLVDLVTDGRKHNAAAAIQSQSPEDFPPKLVSLLGPRFAFRQFPNVTDAAQRFLGLTPDPAIGTLLSDDSEMVSGRCLFRDVQGRVGLLQVMADPIGAVHEALDTNPTDSRVGHTEAAGSNRRGLGDIDAPCPPEGGDGAVEATAIPEGDGSAPTDPADDPPEAAARIAADIARRPPNVIPVEAEDDAAIAERNDSPVGSAHSNDDGVGSAADQSDRPTFTYKPDEEVWENFLGHQTESASALHGEGDDQESAEAAHDDEGSGDDLRAAV